MTPAAALTTHTIAAAISQGCAFLAQWEVDSARLDAEVIMRHVLGMEPAELYAAMHMKLAAAAEQRFWELLRRRSRREPLAYITGRKEFWSLDFVVTRDVLIPRPETELLVEVAVRHVRQRIPNGGLHVLDVGTGSGALAVSLAKELPNSAVTALDVSPAALAIARLNATRHGVDDRIEFGEGDLFTPLKRQTWRFQVLVANPPYVRRRDLACAAPEIRDWEPVIALDGGDEGLDFYTRIVAEAPQYCAAAAFIAVEIGEDMADVISGLFSTDGRYEYVTVHRDYSNKNRVVAAQVAAAEVMNG